MIKVAIQQVKEMNVMMYVYVVTRNGKIIAQGKRWSKDGCLMAIKALI